MTQEPERTCEICGKKFMPKVFWAKYCSHACKQAAYRRKKKAKMK